MGLVFKWKNVSHDFNLESSEYLLKRYTEHEIICIFIVKLYTVMTKEIPRNRWFRSRKVLAYCDSKSNTVYIATTNLQEFTKVECFCDNKLMTEEKFKKVLTYLLLLNNLNQMLLA